MTPARTSAEPEAGAYLDRLIELLVFGRKPFADVPPYSTNEEAAKLVVAKLHRPPLRPLMVRNAEGWSFDWRQPDPSSALEDTAGSRYVRLVSASAASPSLAICRAALKLVQAWGGPPAGPGGSPEVRA
ncbi:MAG: hypothetical protein ABR576_08620 [Thermoanaerobaculia bacterium]